MKRYIFLTVIAVIALLGYAFWTYDACDEGTVQRNVEKIYQMVLDDKDPEHALKKFDKMVQQGMLDASIKEKVIKSNIEVAFRARNSCEIPVTLSQSTGGSYGANKDGNSCPIDAYSSEAQSEYQKLKHSSDYKKAENKLYNNFIGTQEKGSEARRRLNGLWQEPDFRRKIIIASLDMGLRQEAKCSDPAAPMSQLIVEAIKKWSQE